MKTESSEKLSSKLAEASRIGECYECGVCTVNCPLAHMIPGHYNPRTAMLRLFLDPERGLTQIGSWLCMRCRRCSKRCPQKLSPHEIFFLARSAALERGRVTDPSRAMNRIAQLLVEELPLPLISGWLCLRPDESDENSASRTFAEETLKELAGRRCSSNKIPREAAEKVAVVGSGPAGLAAASELLKKGYSVTLFEKSSEPGGMLRHGIPDFRLSKNLVEAEIDHLRDSGAIIKLGTRVGRDTSITTLFEEGKRAIFLAPGCSTPARLRAEGERLEGVIYATEFLEDLNSNGQPKMGDSVLVIGGGNVGIDAARAVMRLKPQKTQLICPESREEMPSDLTEVTRAEREGLQIHPSCMPRRILGKDGRVAGVECVKTKSGQYDRNGRFLLVPIAGTEFSMEVDTVIVAIGQQADLSFLPEKIAVGRGNVIVADPFTMATSMRGVFAGGDAVLGAASVLEAIYAGWKAANSMDRYLSSGGC
mgnify:CR=1 FL=1